MSWFIFRSWDDCDISVIHSVLEVQQMSYSWISTTMEREHDTFGRRTLTLCRWRWFLPMGFWRRHEASIVYVSTELQVSGHGHMRRGLVVNQVTTQRRWLVTASWYDSQGFIVRCRCVSASEEGMKYSDWIWYSKSSMMSSQSYTSRPTVNSDENEVKISAKMRHNYEARDVVNLWRF